MMYAKIINNTLMYPTAAEFCGIPNFLQHDYQLRKRGYMPLVGEAEQRDGYTAEPSAWHTVGEGNTACIQVDSWAYTPIPADYPEPDLEPEPLTPDDLDLENLPKLFSKWELIQAWEGTGDINGVLAQARNDTTMLAAWSSLPEQIDMADLLTQWAQRVALYAGGRTVDKANIIKWLRWIKAHREETP